MCDEEPGSGRGVGRGTCVGGKKGNANSPHVTLNYKLKREGASAEAQRRRGARRMAQTIRGPRDTAFIIKGT